MPRSCTHKWMTSLIRWGSKFCMIPPTSNDKIGSDFFSHLTVNEKSLVNISLRQNSSRDCSMMNKVIKNTSTCKIKLKLLCYLLIIIIMNITSTLDIISLSLEICFTFNLDLQMTSTIPLHMDWPPLAIILWLRHSFGQLEMNRQVSRSPWRDKNSPTSWNMFWKTSPFLSPSKLKDKSYEWF